ncbi:MAG: hemolysin III family protein [Eggerthellaceae bacterium]|nr:hemolysin III family protein [Eggerthellaceae bacterium]
MKAAELREVSQQPAGTPANDDNRRRNVREYTLGEEIANSISHGIGALLAIAAMVLCIVFSVRDGAGVLLASALIYSISMFLEYLMSTLYHAIAADAAKRVFKVLDHSCIYLFIAGSYTPFCLVTMAGVGGMRLGAFVWTVAIVGIAVEAFWVYRPRWVSAVIYLLLGWAVVWYVPVLLQLLPTTGFVLLLVGGLCYTVGSIFYVLKKIPYMHTVFHLLILAGSIFQFFTILLYVL